MVEGLYYTYSENKGADQLRSFREADLRICFRICKKPVFSRRGSFSSFHNMAGLEYSEANALAGNYQNLLCDFLIS